MKNKQWDYTILFRIGGENISTKIHFTLILAVILIFGISATSANEINSNDVNSSNDYSTDTSNFKANNVLNNNNEASDNVESYVSENTADSSEKIENTKQNNDESTENNKISNSQTTEPINIKNNNQVNKNSYLSVASTTVVNGRNLNVYLKNSVGKGISGQKLTLTLNNKKYTLTTNANGECSLKINSKRGTHPIKVTYAGNNNHLAVSKVFQIKVYKEKTIISVASTSIVRGKYLYVYLKNSAGKGIAGQRLTLTFNKKKYALTTNANGRCSLKMDYAATKNYPAKVNYRESTSYLSSSKSFKVKVHKQSTKITVKNKSILRGTCMHISLKDTKGNALPSKRINIKFNGKNFKRYTNKKGEASLRITSKSGHYPVKIKYAGSESYSASSSSFTAKSYVYKTKIEVSNKKIRKGKYLNIHLKNSDNKAIPKQKITINFNNNKHTKTTDNDGQTSLKIDTKAKNYKITIKYSGSTSYVASSKTLTITVVDPNAAKIIAINKISNGDYSVRLVDNNGNPIANKNIKLAVYESQAVGTGKAINKKTIILNSDRIHNTDTDIKLLNDIAHILRNKGYNVIVNTNINPNAHCSDIMGKYSDACVFCIFGGTDSGMFVDMASSWYQNYLKKYNNQVVLGFTRTSRDISTETWLERAHDDNYSPSSFTGLANPGTYLNENGFDYVYGNTATQLAENFLTFAVNGLSIGKNSGITSKVTTYTVTTNKDGYATITGLTPGTYTIISSDQSTGYNIDPTTSYLTVK